jgi:hypothetical protein
MPAENKKGTESIGALFAALRFNFRLQASSHQPSS